MERFSLSVNSVTGVRSAYTVRNNLASQVVVIDDASSAIVALTTSHSTLWTTEQQLLHGLNTPLTVTQLAFILW